MSGVSPEHSLTRAFQLYQNAARSMPKAGVLICDRDMQVLAVEGEAFRSDEVDLEWLVGRDLRRILPKVGLASHLSLYSRALAGERVDHVQDWEDGRTFLVRFGPLRDERDGEVVGAMTVSLDITAQRQAEIQRERAEEALHAALQRQRLVLSNLPGTIVALYDRDLRVTDIQGLEQSPTEHTSESVRGAHIREFFEVEYYAAKLEPIMLAALEGQPASFEHTSAEGRSFAVDVAPFTEGDEITGVLTVWHDVTERVQLERERRAADEQFRTAFEAAPIGMVLMEGDGTFLSINPAVEEITGYTFEQLRELPPFHVTHPDDLEEVRAAFFGLGSESDSVRTEHRVVRADGQAIWVDVRITLLRDEAGEPTSVLAQVHDSTGRRTHEESLRRHAEQLAAIAEVARAVGRSDPLHARQAVCRTAVAVGDGATMASIWEPRPDGSLQTTANLPESAAPRRIAADAVKHGAHVVLATGEPLFVADAADSPHCDSQIISTIGAASVLFVPIDRRGVLAVGWQERLSEISKEQRLLMGVLADEAAVAMQRADLLNRLDELTRTDELTGLPNRRAWDELLTHELASAKRHGKPLSLAMLDLDHFKRYNDEHGHLAGDRLLRDAAHAWQKNLRATDVLARWGGEEFALLLPACGARDAATLIERLRALMPGGVTFSAGVTTTDGSAPARALLNTADQALYDAKANGRDRIEIREIT